MKREKLLISIILVLVLINSATLLFMWINRPPHPPHGHGPHQRPDKMIIERLNLDNQQQEKFSDLKEEHHSNMVKIDEELKEVRKKYFSLLKNDARDIITKDSLEHQLAVLAIKKEQATYDHFEQLKNLCNPQQRENFYKLTEELSEIFSRPPPPRR